ncbi:MAG TPA: hypothetical protein P5531_04395 [Bacteroidales bacterium]|nr:hypothetical protein [Bacteroidales bacterium]HSA42757.1 hypothetical protein [Bacteroidales bacterium]
MQNKNHSFGQKYPVYFWDFNIARMENHAHKRVIIERIFTLGDVPAIREIIRYYGEEEVVSTLQTLNYLDPKTLNFASIVFNKPLNQFKCYHRTRSKKQRWNS